LDPLAATLLWLREREDGDIKDLAGVLSSELTEGLLSVGEATLFPSASCDLPERADAITVPLTSVLSQVSVRKLVDGKALSVGPSEPHGLPLTSLSGEAAFPRPLAELSIDQADYASLLKRFEEDFHLWVRAGGGIAPLLMLLEKHFHAVPLCPGSSEPEGRETSLFDYVKTLAAIGSALSRYREDQPSDAAPSVENKELCFIGGDISGLQGFLYSLSSKGALKTLRARSFFLELLCEHSVSELISALNLNETNILYVGGGRFNILSHWSEKVLETLRDFEKKINAHLRRLGELTLVLGVEPTSTAEISSDGIMQLRRSLGLTISKLKSQKHLDSLQEILAPQEPRHTTSACAVCNTDDVAPDEFRELDQGAPTGAEARVACPFCFSMTRLGTRLGDWRYVAGLREGVQEDGFQLPCYDGTSLMYRGYSDVKSLPSNAQRIFCLNSWHIDDYPGPWSRQMLVANTVRKKGELNSHGYGADQESGDDTSASFEGLAACARGRKRIGVLRMDVDHLGTVFATGLGDRVSFTRLASLSRNLNLFFKQQVSRICEGKAEPGAEGSQPTDFSGKHPEDIGRNVSIVYSGGDDLFIVGAWDEVLETSIDIYHSFRSYCASNPALTISAGFAANSIALPLHTMAKMAGEAEQASKRQGRARITFFAGATRPVSPSGALARNPTIEWEQLQQKVVVPLQLFLALSDMDEEENRFKPRFSRGLVYGLLRIHELWREVGKLYLPRMAYVLSRLQISLDKVQGPGLEEAKSRLFRMLMNEEDMEYLHIPLTWFGMLCRHSGENEQ